MPKIRTHKTTAKRFKKTASGKYKRHRAYATHLMGKKTTKRRRRLRQGTLLSAADTGRIKRLIP